MPQNLGIIASHVTEDFYEDGTLLGIGINHVGQLGQGFTETTTQGNTSGNNTRLTEIGEPKWVQISTSRRGVLAIDENQDMWAWGENGSYSGNRLGLGPNFLGTVSTPTKIITPDKKWSFVCGGSHNSAAIDTEGDLYFCGIKNNNINGDFTSLNTFRRFTHLPDKKWLKVSIGGNSDSTDYGSYAFAIDTDGVMWTWGQNLHGRTGLNKPTGTSSTNNTNTPESGTDPIRTNRRWKDVSCGYVHTAAIDEEGYIYMCGWKAAFPNNQYKPATDANPLFIKIQDEPIWESVYCVVNGRGSTNQYYMSYAIKKDGTLWSFGQNDSRGRIPIGNGLSNSLSYDFTQIGADRKWKKIISDNGEFPNHVLFIDENDIPFGMGANLYGIVTQLTKNSPILTLTPFSNKFRVKDVANLSSTNSYFIVKSSKKTQIPPTPTPTPSELQPDTLPSNPEPFSDSEISWTTSSTLPVGSQANYFSSSEDGQYQIVSDTSGYLKVSSNNGTSWNEITSLPQGEWVCVVVSRSGEIMMATRGDANIYVSNDYGQNWTAKPVSSPANSCDMSYNGLYQIVVGNNGEIHRSSNYGSTWNTITLPEGVSPSFLDQISMSRNGLVCLVGGSVPYFSLDAGNTWTSTNLSEGDWRALTCSSSDGSIMYAWNFDNNYTIWKSTNFGVDWTELTNTEVIWGNTMQTSYDGKYAIIVTNAQNRGVFVTKDFGNTWNVYQNNLSFDCMGAYCSYSGSNLGFAQWNTPSISYGQWS
jgi:alpha-tubulin suppressor-like RCC1 family protein/photosystem II stability/assembly factor-like uncharacterized protein